MGLELVFHGWGHVLEWIALDRPVWINDVQFAFNPIEGPMFLWVFANKTLGL